MHFLFMFSGFLIGVLAGVVLIIMLTRHVRVTGDTEVHSQPITNNSHYAEHHEDVDDVDEDSQWESDAYLGQTDSSPTDGHGHEDYEDYDSVDTTHSEMINRIRLEYLAPIAAGLKSYSQTRNRKGLVSAGKVLRDNAVWLQLYLEAQGESPKTVQTLYIALGDVEHSANVDLDQMVVQASTAACALEVSVEALADSYGIAPWIGNGIIHRLLEDL